MSRLSLKIYIFCAATTLTSNFKLLIHSYKGTNWISLVHNSYASWELRMYVNLTVRNDTGRLNTSPVTTMTPIVRLKWGCNHTINIPGMYNPYCSTTKNLKKTNPLRTHKLLGSGQRMVSPVADQNDPPHFPKFFQGLFYCLREHQSALDFEAWFYFT